MAKAVTLKNSNDEEVYPVTDISLVNGDISTGRITDAAVTTAKIADDAVTSGKINWSSLGAKYKQAAGQIEVGTTTTTLLTLALTAGTWLLIGTANFNHANTDTGDCYVGFNNADANTALGNRYYFNERANGTYWSNETCSMAATLTGNTNVSFVALKVQGTLRAMRYSFTAVRIG